MARRGKLTKEQQTFVVQGVACFDTPKTVADALKVAFGVEISPQAVEKYDPTKRAGAALSAQWRAVFEESRKAFLDDTASIAIANRAVRLRMLQRMAEKAEERKNYPLAAQLIEQAAKECGDAYSNTRKLQHTGKDGESLPTPPAPVTIFQLPDNGRG